MSAFNELMAHCSGKANLGMILVDGGMCTYRYRKDDVVVIKVIIVLPESQGKGIGKMMLERLKRLRPVAIQANCPETLPSNRWYEHQGFVKTAVKRGRNQKINTWTLRLRKE